MHFLSVFAQVCGFVTTIAAAIVLLIKPIRNRVLGLNEIREGQKCLLRSEMLRIYYQGKEADNILRQ